MNGLLDFIQTPGGQGLLGAIAGYAANAQRGTPVNNLGRGGLSGLLAYGGAQDRINADADGKMKRGYMQSQIDENVSQNAARAQTLKQQAAKDAYFMGTPGASMLPDAPTSPGAYQAPAFDGVGPVAPMPTTGAAPKGGKFDEWAAQLNIPKDALMADYTANGGKGIADMLFKRGTPDMQVTNGYAYDKNRQGAGFMPSLSTSTNGQTSMTQIGGNGMPVVSAPQGALETAAAYKGIDSGLKPIKVFNPETQREEYTSEAKVLGVAPTSAPSVVPAVTPGQIRNPMAARPGDSDQRAIFEQEYKAAQGRLTAAVTPEQKVRAQTDLNDLGREMKRINMPVASNAPASGNFAAGPSATDAATAKATETRMVDSSKAGTARIMTGYDNARTAVDSITSNLEARKSLAGGAFVGTGAETKLAISKGLQSLGFDVAPDKATNTDYLQSTLGSGILNKAKTLGANPTDNDARIIKAIVGSIGTDPNALVKLLNHQDLMSNRAIDDHNKNYSDSKTRGFDAGFDLTVKASSASEKQATPSKPAPSIPMKGMVRNGYKFNGGDPANQANWEKQ